MEDRLDAMLWWIIGIVAGLLALGVIVPTLYGRSARKKEKRLSHRAKRRIVL